MTAISLTANDEYVVPAVVLLESLRGNVPEGLELIVRDAGLGRASRELITRQAASSGFVTGFPRVDVAEFRPAALLGHWSEPSAFARLYPYPPEHRYVLDLDVDLLVRQPLHDLLQRTPGDDAVLLAVPAHFTPTLWRDEVKSTDDLDVRESDSFFMGGVCVLDTTRWEAVSSRTRELFRSDPGRWKSDLSLLNVACARSWAALDRRWNVWTLARRGPFCYVRVDGAVPRAVARSRDVAIAHFPGHFKPWLPHYPRNRWRLEYAKVWQRSALAGRAR